MPKDVLEDVNEHIKLSPLYNPYTEGSFILKWAIHKHQRRTGVLGVVGRQRARKENKEDCEGRNILKSAPNPVLPVIAPNYYRYRGETEDHDHYIPKWDITLDQLQVLYDKARFKRYLEWSSKSLKRATPNLARLSGEDCSMYFSLPGRHEYNKDPFGDTSFCASNFSMLLFDFFVKSS